MAGGQPPPAAPPAPGSGCPVPAPAASPSASAGWCSPAPCPGGGTTGDMGARGQKGSGGLWGASTSPPSPNAGYPRIPPPTQARVPPHPPPPPPAQGTPMSPPSPSPRCPHTPPLQPRVPPCPPPPPSPGSLHVIVSVHPHLHLAQGAPTPPLPPFHHGTPPAAPTGADTHQGSELLHRLQQQLLVPQAPHSQCLQCPRRQPQQVEPRQPPGLEGVPLYGRIQPCPQPCPSTSRTPREGGGRPSTPPPVSLLADPSLLGGTRPRDEFARSQPRWRVWPDVHPAIGRIQGQTPPFCPPTRDKG